MHGIQKNGIDEPIFRAGIEMQTWRMDSWTQLGKEWMRQIERITLVYIHIETESLSVVSHSL